MNRCRTLSTNNLLPLSDPEAIIRATNTARQHLTQPVRPTQTSSMTHSPGNTNSNIPHLPDNSYHVWFRLVIKAQHAALIQSEQDRRAVREAAEDNASRIARLQDHVLALAVKSEEPACRTCLDNDKLDLQKFCTSDGPKFFGPPMTVKPFVKWVSGLQIFFTTKNVIKASDKIKIIGGLINDSNLLKFYANEVSNYLTGSWEAFKTCMFQVGLPLNWRMELRKQIHQLAMTATKSFMDYSTRARTLQTLANFDASDAMKIADNDLAQFVVFRLPQNLQDPVTEHQIMEKVPFKYSYFEQRVSASVAAARSSTATSVHSQAMSTNQSVSKEDFIWRVHAYLDSEGKCHFCKKTCGNAAGTCPGPVDKKYIPLPDSFQTPQKPPNYTPPRAWSNAGKPTHPPAGRPTTRLATVAGVAEEDEFDVAALASVQAELAEDGLFNYATKDLEGSMAVLIWRVSLATKPSMFNVGRTKMRTFQQPPPCRNSRLQPAAGHKKKPSPGPKLPMTLPGPRPTTMNAPRPLCNPQQVTPTGRSTPPYAGPLPPGLPTHLPRPSLPLPLPIFPPLPFFPHFYYYYPPLSI
ncbi:hypothetical protein PSTG_04117 [Puccinia striiformis f. sp. tritici PST-78]|uniref:Retrotransposon gag domain-containing protein n=1 Tax=Puccinia striiformis f. sp. tritici PST-78 TaxID=1165861 RepID=A0A0L0VUE1_9BASI|nr:hypothetical protein PSTG_04117 [Puccinia striiformis f. sp. tritici PST-78]